MKMDYNHDQDECRIFGLEEIERMERILSSNINPYEAETSAREIAGVGKFGLEEIERALSSNLNPDEAGTDAREIAGIITLTQTLYYHDAPETIISEQEHAQPEPEHDRQVEIQVAGQVYKDDFAGSSPLGRGGEEGRSASPASGSSSGVKRKSSFELERNRRYCTAWRLRKKEEESKFKNDIQFMSSELDQYKAIAARLQISVRDKDQEILSLKQRISLLELELRKKE